MRYKKNYQKNHSCEKLINEKHNTEWNVRQTYRLRH